MPSDLTPGAEQALADREMVFVAAMLFTAAAISHGGLPSKTAAPGTVARAYDLACDLMDKHEGA
jgi:hypothetical protein